jgi:hypothetical protein
MNMKATSRRRPADPGRVFFAQLSPLPRIMLAIENVIA